MSVFFSPNRLYCVITPTKQPGDLSPHQLERDPLTAKVIGCAIEVRRILGPGLLESVYEECLTWELKQAGLRVKRQAPQPIFCKDATLDCGFRMDLVVEDKLIIELKAVEKPVPIHEAQLLTYLRLSGMSKGLLLNFNTSVLRDGIRRFVM